ncbi:MAG: hypothetical protein E2P02_08090 [Acidobacteria bacterium]|nr:MAG: hypothetical protein E2P02_08090 [Acidobacteriota bacterium]
MTASLTIFPGLHFEVDDFHAEIVQPSTKGLGRLHRHLKILLKRIELVLESFELARGSFVRVGSRRSAQK